MHSTIKAQNKINLFSEFVHIDQNNIEHETVSICYGHFNTIHPGHIRYLSSAKKTSSKLFVAVKSENDIGNSNINYFSSMDRALGLAALEMVDHVVILDEGTLVDLVKMIVPNALILGNEIEIKKDYHVKKASKIIEAGGGRVLFDGGNILYNENVLSNVERTSANHSIKNNFLQLCNEYSIGGVKLLDSLNEFSKAKVMVIGDTIIDEYIACDTLGLSAEAPVPVVKEIGRKQFIGGAAIVASHIASMGADCCFLSVTGEDSEKLFLENELKERGVKSKILVDEFRPTTLKTRYMVGHHKLLRVSKLVDKDVNLDLQNKIIDFVEKSIASFDAIFISDFVYGVITETVLKNIIKIAKKNNVLLYGDQQSSSQTGNLSTFKGFDLLTPTEKEARIATGMRDNGIEEVALEFIKITGVKNLLMKLGSDGFIFYFNDGQEIEKLYFNALSKNAVDVAGAGDCLISTVGTCLSQNRSRIESGLLGALAAAIAVETVGNIPVSLEDLRSMIE